MTDINAEYDIEKMEKQRQELFNILQRVVDCTLSHESYAYKVYPTSTFLAAEQLICDIKNGVK